MSAYCFCGWDKPFGPKCPDCGGYIAWLCTGASDCRAPLHEHGCFADLDGSRCTDSADHGPTAADQNAAESSGSDLEAEVGE